MKPQLNSKKWWRHITKESKNKILLSSGSSSIQRNKKDFRDEGENWEKTENILSKLIETFFIRGGLYKRGKK